MPLLIGIGHRARHGKDAIADHLVSKYGFRRIGWADLLKKGVNTWHGWDDRHAFGELKEVVDPYWGYSPRHAYVKIGTDLMRDQWHRNFWVKAAMRQVSSWMNDGINVCIPDCRFSNEAAAVLESGGHLWHVNRPGLPAPDPENEHESETALLGFDGWTQRIENDGTLSDLYAKLDKLMARIS